METKRKILKKQMSKKYCNSTRFNYLDDEERPMIYKAMQEYAEQYHKQQLQASEKPSDCSLDNVSLDEQSETVVCKGCFNTGLIATGQNTSEPCTCEWGKQI